MTRPTGSGSWNITPNSTTEVHAWYGTQAEWNALSPAQQAFYEVHVIEVNQGNTNADLVDSTELRTALVAYAGYNITTAAGPIGTLSVDTDNNPATPIVPTVGVAIDGKAIESSQNAIVISLDPITATTLPGTYKGGASLNHFQPFKPGTLTQNPVCFLRGTMILTVAGEKPVEALEVGDLVVTADNGPQPVALVMSTVVMASQLARQPELRPIRISRGALGPNCPADDLRVSPQHRMLVRSRIARHIFGADEILVAAKQLLRIEGVDIDDTPDDVEYFHVLFDRHQVVFANGAASESLYTGPEGLRSVGFALREEIFKLFPHLRTGNVTPIPARLLASGRMGRKLAWRHAQKRRDLVM